MKECYEYKIKYYQSDGHWIRRYEMIVGHETLLFKITKPLLVSRKNKDQAKLRGKAAWLTSYHCYWE